MAGAADLKDIIPDPPKFQTRKCSGAGTRAIISLSCSSGINSSALFAFLWRISSGMEPQPARLAVAGFFRVSPARLPSLKTTQFSTQLRACKWKKGAAGCSGCVPNAVAFVGALLLYGKLLLVTKININISIIVGLSVASCRA
jgi:hypothetical protein